MKKSMGRGILGALFLVLAASPAWALRIAYVDIGKIFERYQGTQKAKLELQRKAESEKVKLEKDQDKLKTKLQTLQAKKKVLTEENYGKQEQALLREMRDLQDRITTVQQNLVREEKQLTAQIVDEIREVAQKVADKEKYDYVFELNALLFGGTEITNTVLRDLNDRK